MPVNPCRWPRRRGRARAAARLAGLALCLACAAGCEPRGEPAPAAPVARNAILLLVDTLRADHLSLYGYERDTSPNLRRLAESAVVFERARSQAPCTFPSVNSLLTSRHPVSFLGQGRGRYGIPRETVSVAEMLRDRGFATFAASASSVVRATPSRHNRAGGFARGFDTFDESCLDQSAACIDARAGDFLASGAEPFFAYLHYMDPHGPYRPPPEHVRRFARTPHPNALVAAGDPLRIEQVTAKRGTAFLTPAAVEHLTDLYDDEIAYWDGQLARLFAELERRGLLDRTIVVLAADHGEGFLEHGYLNHCRTLYDVETHTPLVMWIPGVAGRRIGSAVENLDVVPTLLDYLGVAPASGLAGESLRQLIEGTSPAAKRHAHSFHLSLRSVDDARYKRIVDVASRQARLFDLVADPRETTDLAAHPPEEAAPLNDALVAWIEANEPRGAEWSVAESRKVEQGLRALGYIE
jgi:arylsulfatase